MMNEMVAEGKAFDPHVNVSRMSPKLVRTSPHILENRGITMAPLFLILIS